MINELPESLLSQIIFFPEPHRNCDCFIITAAVTEITFSKHPTRLIPYPSSTAAIATPSQNGVSRDMGPPTPGCKRETFEHQVEPSPRELPSESHLC